MRKKSLKEILERFIEVHGDKYDYSKVNYVNIKTKVCIICPEHGEFWQSSENHLKGKGCPSCFGNKKLNSCNFIQKAHEVHGDKYDYSKVVYINNKTKVCIICPEHGEFWQKPYNHLQKKGCCKCVGKNKTTEEFIKQSNIIHNNKYDYSKVVYINNHTKVCIICPEHGEFWQTPANHLSGRGCNKCKYDEFKLSITEFVQKANIIHNNKYDYSKVVYNGCQDRICIICPEHGEFWQTPSSHFQNNGCPRCSKLLSNVENDLKDFIKNNYNNQILYNIRNIISPYELDIYLPDLKLAFEFNGLYWHSELYKDKNYHLNKTLKCEEQGIHLVQIYEDDWNFKQEIVKSRILNLLGKSNKLYARNCKIKEISFKDAKEFLESNHLQGGCVDKVRLGLYDGDALVSLMTFGKLRKNLGQKDKEGCWELLRFCNKLNISVIGGAHKLFNYFIKNFEFKNILSYADRSWTMNNGKTLYDKLGFYLKNLSQPNYFYINNMIRENRFKYRKDQLIKKGFDPNKSEHEIMLGQGLYRIYDSGCAKYIFSKE